MTLTPLEPTEPTAVAEAYDFSPFRLTRVIDTAAAVSIIESEPV